MAFEAKRSDPNGVSCLLTYASPKSPALRETAGIVHPLARATGSSMRAYYQEFRVDSISSLRLIYLKDAEIFREQATSLRISSYSQ